MLASVAMVSVAGLVMTLVQQREQDSYNEAIARADYAEAAKFGGDRGRFAEAFGRQLQGEVDDARVIYGDLGRADDAGLRAAAFYNLGNSYMKQVRELDIEADSDRAFPLIELAKMNYRKSLAIDSENWDARRNLQRALLLLPDANPRVPMEVEGRRGAVRTVTSADSEKNYP
ncbi:MAG: hypothetical protein ACU85V_04160 [Gammaproteobacteria bacterium]